MIKHFFILGPGGMVERFHRCPVDELQNFMAGPEIKIEVSEPTFDYASSLRNGRISIDGAGGYVFTPDATNPEIMNAQARAARAELLAASDWTQLPDVPLATKQAWADYRQALRDITGQPGYPLEITWPTPPGAQS